MRPRRPLRLPEVSQVSTGYGGVPVALTVAEETTVQPAGKSAIRELWLAERRRGLGGSDAAPACGMSPWKTPFELYLDKTGQLPPEKMTEAMKLGVHFEAALADLYSAETGRSLFKPPMLWHHSHKWM